MNRFRQYCLLLCSALVFLGGFLLTGNTSYAYTAEDNFYPILLEDTNIAIRDSSGTNIYVQTLSPNNDGVYKLNNGDLSGVSYIYFWDSSDGDPFTFPFNPLVYDYYLLGTVVADCNYQYKDKSTFKPTTVQVTGYDANEGKFEQYPTSGLTVYDVDTHYKLGFGFYQKINFTAQNNIGIRSIVMHDDINGSGTKPAKLQLQFAVMAVQKNDTVENIQAQILQQLKQMEISITENIQNGANSVSTAVGQSAEKISGSIDDAKEEISNKIEEQYDMEENEDFGVGEIQKDVEEKLGVLNFTADTLTGFLDLFNSSTVGDSVITFPSYSIEVQGEQFTVWDNIEFDLSFLEENFGILITAVRTITVLCVWLAVLSYLGKAKDQIIINRG